MEGTQALETSLSSLLQEQAKDPWAQLMIQTLVWCFRRWAIHYLTSDEATTSMREFLWESHLDLVDQFSPPDLREFAILWLNPEHVGERADALEALNQCLLQIVDAFDHALQTESETEQDMLADFLDVRITEIMDECVEERYRIYPGRQESPDSFSTAKIYTIMEGILDKFAPPSEGGTQEPAPQPEQIADEEIVPPPQEPLQPPPQTVAAALNRRRTRKRIARLCIKKTRKNRHN